MFVCGILTILATFTLVLWPIPLFMGYLCWVQAKKAETDGDYTPFYERDAEDRPWYLKSWLQLYRERSARNDENKS